MFDGLIFFVAFLLICYAFYKWATLNNDFFEQRNIKNVKPTFLIGNNAGSLFNKYTGAEFCKKLYQTFPDES